MDISRNRESEIKRFLDLPTQFSNVIFDIHILEETKMFVDLDWWLYPSWWKAENGWQYVSSWETKKFEKSQ